MNKIPFEILVDTREQRPYLFDSIKPIPATSVTTLKTGDYSLSGFSDEIIIERKSLADAFQTFGKGRQRFIRELERMSKYNFAIVIIEADWLTILRHPPARSRLNPKSVYASIVAWMQRYNVHFMTAPNRAFAEKTTYRLLDRYYRDYQEGSQWKKRLTK